MLTLHLLRAPVPIPPTQSRFVVLLEDPAALREDGFPDEPAPVEEHHVLAYHTCLNIRQKTMIDGAQIYQHVTDRVDEEDEEDGLPKRKTKPKPIKNASE